MTLKHSLALNLAPLLIRLALAATFIWAGLSKVSYTMEVSGEQAAALANLGVIKPSAPVTPAPNPAAPSDATPTPVEPVPATAADSPIVPPPSERPASSDNEPASVTPAPSDTPVEPGASEPAPTDAADPPASDAPVSRTPRLPPLLVLVQPADSATPTAANQSGGTTTAATTTGYTAQDFPGTHKVARLHGITLLQHKLSQPNDKGNRVWPQQLGDGRWPAIMAWAAALTELVGGFMVLIGFFTRFWSLGLASTMAVAMWMTQIGPVIAGSVAGWLGFLPDPVMADAARWNSLSSGWHVLLLQFTLLMAALAVVASGPGAFSIDRLIFRARPRSRPAPRPA